MSEFRKLEKVSLAALPNFNEAQVQEYIFKNPEVLDLGELHGLRREHIQQSGGRLDMILEGGDTWYEVEVQLGPTDPSHIIRTIEYWDNERWRYPNVEHVAVLIAEEVTGRFFNVISLFNKHIPLIAFQMAAFKTDNGDMTLTFSKVLDLVSRDPEDEIAPMTYDLDYWLDAVGEERMETTQQIFEDLLPSEDGFRMKYNKYYVGVMKDGVVKNFVETHPRKTMTVLKVKLPRSEEYDSMLDGIDWDYDNQWGRYRLKFSTFEKYAKAKPAIMPLVLKAAELMGVELQNRE